jgi:hypothetical protein
MEMMTIINLISSQYLGSFHQEAGKNLDQLRIISEMIFNNQPGVPNVT